MYEFFLADRYCAFFVVAQEGSIIIAVSIRTMKVMLLKLTFLISSFSECS